MPIKHLLYIAIEEFSNEYIFIQIDSLLARHFKLFLLSFQLVNSTVTQTVVPSVVPNVIFTVLITLYQL